MPTVDRAAARTAQGPTEGSTTPNSLVEGATSDAWDVGPIAQRLLQLQHAAGNGAVTRLVGDIHRQAGAGTGGTPQRDRESTLGLRQSASVTGRAGARPPLAAQTSRPNAGELIGEQYPFLAAEVLSPRQVADVQRVLDARHELAGLGPSGRSRQEIERAGTPAGQTLVVPTFAILDDDMWEPAPWPPEDAFKKQLRETVLTYPVRLVIEEGLRPKPLFKFIWGRTDKELGHRDGRIHYWTLTQDAHWGQQHARVMSGRPRERDPMSELIRSAIGQRLVAQGRVVGSYWNGLWDVTIRVGLEIGQLTGEPDDPRGHKALLDASRGAGATITLKAPDGRLHRYGLDPSFQSWVLNRPYVKDGFMYLKDNGTEVPDAHEITTADGETLERAASGRTTGWRVADDGTAPGHVEQFLWGAVIGDYFEDPTAASTLGAVVGGISPLGWIGDLRDTYRGVKLILAGEYKEGIVDTAFALLGFLPGAGDYAKKALKRPTKEVVTELIDATRKVIESAERAARKSGQSLDEFMGGAKKVTTAVPSSLMDPGLMRIALMTDTVAEKLARENLRWADVIRHYRRIGQSGLADDLHRWRIKKIDDLRLQVARDVLGDTPEIWKASSRTGTDDPLSDVDVSFLGPKASEMKQLMANRMSATFNDQWSSIVKSDVFTDPRRLALFEELAPAARQPIEAALLRETGLNAFAKMIFEGGDLLSTKRALALAKRMGFDEVAVLARAQKLEAIAKSSGTIPQMELEVDKMEALFRRTKDPGLAQKIAETQSLINAAGHGAYVTPGGVARHVIRRERLAGKQAYKALSPEMKKMAFIDDLAAMEGAFRSLRTAGASQDVMKDVSKYAERLLRATGHAGVDTLTLDKTYGMWRAFAVMLEDTRKGLPPRRGELGTQARLLHDELMRIAGAVAKTAKTPPTAELSEVLREMARLILDTAVRLTQGPGKEELKQRI